MDDREKGDLQRRFGNGMFYEFAMRMADTLDTSREKSLMLTKLEEAQDWWLRARRPIGQEGNRVQPERVVHDDYGTAHSDSC